MVMIINGKPILYSGHSDPEINKILIHIALEHPDVFPMGLTIKFIHSISEYVYSKRFDKLYELMGVNFLKSLLSYYCEKEDYETCALLKNSIDSMNMELNLVWEDE